MENFPWVGCGVLLVTGLVRLGAKKVNQDLNDLKSCPSMESVRVSDGFSLFFFVYYYYLVSFGLLLF